MDRMCEPISERFDVFATLNEIDPDLAIRERGINVVAVLTSGKDPIDAALMDRLPKLRLIVAVGAATRASRFRPRRYVASLSPMRETRIAAMWPITPWRSLWR